MICKESFIKIMDSLRDYWDGLDNLMNTLNINMDQNFLTDISDKIMDALVEDLEARNEYEDYEPWIYYYAFELNWGQDDNAEDCVKIGEESFSLQNAGQLYDLLEFLTWK